MTSPADLAARTLDLARAELGPATEIEVLTERQHAALTRFANSYIHQNVAEESSRVSLRIHRDGRTASAHTNSIGDDGLRALVGRVAAAARLLPADPLWPGLAPPAALAGHGPVDPGTVDATPAARADRVKAFVAAAEGLVTAGYCGTAHVESAFANSAGQQVFSAYTEAAFDGVARATAGAMPADGVARLASSRLGDIDGAALGARAAGKARGSVDAAYLPPGEYEVVLEPEAVGDVLASLALYGFNGKMFAERQSFARPGEAQFDPALSFVDDPAAGRPFDTEGTPKRRLALVRDGVTAAVTHNRRTAGEVGAESTGHAGPGSDVWGPIATNLAIETAPDHGVDLAADVATLVSDVDRGLLVTDIWYTRVLDPRPLIMTGLTRNGVWLIEKGEVAGPVRNLRFTQAYPQALGPGRVLGVGRHAVTQPTHGFGYQSYRAPALRLAAWRFTGGAEG
jgi:predicted Zn-dependent protease